MKDISDSFNLTQLCSSPTHLDKTGQPCSLLDLAFTNLADYCRSGTLPPLSSSDHLPVMVNVNLEIYTSGQSYCWASSARWKRNFSSKSLEKMLKSFSPSNWKWLHRRDGTDIDSLWSRWKKQLFEEVDHFIPACSTAPSSQKSKRWFTSYLQHLIRLKNRLYRRAMRTRSVENWGTYRLARNKCNNAVKLA